ncbi:MAG: hypothetical protein HFJ07_16685 [Lachnospiraceae bacterium]|nr:hypothetical protein [Lachnospiraceae bacterium]
MLKYWGIKTGKRFFFARFYMHTPMQRKYAIAWRIDGARVVKMNLLYSIAQPHAEEVCRKSGAGGGLSVATATPSFVKQHSQKNILRQTLRYLAWIILGLCTMLQSP